MSQTCVVVVFFVLSHCFCAECYSQIASLSEIVGEHSRINENAINSGGYSRTTSLVNRSSEAVANSRVLVDYKSGSVLFENREHKGSPFYVNSLYSINPRYCFKLTSKGNADWVLFKYVISDSPELNLKNVGLGADYTRPQNMKDNVSVFPSFRALGGTSISLPNLFKFKQISNATTKQLTSSEIELTFDRTIAWGYDPDGEMSLAGKKTKCRMVLNSSPPYLPVSFSESYEKQLTITGTFEYEKPGQYSGRIIQRITEDWQDNKSELTAATALVVGAPPKREFLLSNYGFNEPSELRDTGMSTFWIFVSLGVMFVLAGVLLRFFRRK